MIRVATRHRTGSAVYESDAERWAAVAGRDRRADGVFYYSVRTTGVYCRPSCAARLARRENVRFHATCGDAERAGFRPCKRCRPDGHGLDATRAETVARACRLIEAAEEVPSLDALADAAGLSRFHFHRVFKTTTGLTPKAFAAAHRARRVRDELSRSDTVTDAIYGAGYNSSGRFYATSSEVLGMTPTVFRAGGACSATTRTPWRATSKTGSRRPGSSVAIGTSSGSSRRWWALSRRRRGASTCRWTCAARRSSSACGRRCARSPREPRRPTRRSPHASVRRGRCGRWRRRARPTRSRWPSPATASCATTAGCRATAGA